MEFNQLLKVFEADFGIEGLELDAEHEISFMSEDVLVTIKEDEGHFFFATVLCSAIDDDLATYKYMLSENDFGALGGYIGMDQRDKTFVLTTKLPMNGLTAEKALKRLGMHFASVEHIRQGVDNLALGGNHHGDSADDMLVMAMHAIRI